MTTTSSAKRTTQPITSSPYTSLRNAGRATFVWVVIFIAFHIYWALGGHFGFGDAPTTIPPQRNLAAKIFSLIILGMFIVGTIVPLALYHNWGRRIPAWILSWCCWIGGGLLSLRGLAGVLDSLLRGTGLMHQGLTGLSYEQELGVAHPSAYTLISGSAIDLYFALGGVLFLWAAVAHGRSRRARGTTV